MQINDVNIEYDFKKINKLLPRYNFINLSIS